MKKRKKEKKRGYEETPTKWNDSNESYDSLDKEPHRVINSIQNQVLAKRNLSLA